MLVTFDGHDGVGKTTIVNEVAVSLTRRGFKVVVCTPTSRFAEMRPSFEISEYIIHPALEFYMLSNLYASVKYHSLIAKDAIDIMLVDRYIFSTLALFYARGFSLPWNLLGLLQLPHLAFRITVKEEIRRQRLLLRKDPINPGDKGSLDYTLIRKADTFYKRMGLIEIDNSGKLQTSVDRIVRIIEEFLAV